MLWYLEGVSVLIKKYSLIFLLLIGIPNNTYANFDSFRPSQLIKLAYECGIKEPWVLSRTLQHYVSYSMNPHLYGLNPKVPFVDTKNKTAHIIIFLPSMLGGSYNFIDWAKAYQSAGIKNVYAVESVQSQFFPVPLHSLFDSIHRISNQCFDQGAETIYFSLQGHSFGALVSSKMIWRGEVTDPRINLNMIISIGGRLRYLPNEFAWFYEDVRPDIEETYQAFLADPSKAQLLTIWGDRDFLVPQLSAHIQGSSKNEVTVPGFGHLGIIYSDEAISEGLQMTLKWYNQIF